MKLRTSVRFFSNLTESDCFVGTCWIAGLWTSKGLTPSIFGINAGPATSVTHRTGAGFGLRLRVGLSVTFGTDADNSVPGAVLAGDVIKDAVHSMHSRSDTLKGYGCKMLLPSGNLT